MSPYSYFPKYSFIVRAICSLNADWCVPPCADLVVHAGAGGGDYARIHALGEDDGAVKARGSFYNLLNRVHCVLFLDLPIFRFVDLPIFRFVDLSIYRLNLLICGFAAGSTTRRLENADQFRGFRMQILYRYRLWTP